MGREAGRGDGPLLPKTQIESSTDAHQFGLLGFWTPSMDHVSPKQSSQWFQQSPPVNPRGAPSAPGLLPQSSPHTMAQAAPYLVQPLLRLLLTSALPLVTFVPTSLSPDSSCPPAPAALISQEKPLPLKQCSTMKTLPHPSFQVSPGLAFYPALCPRLA